MNYWWLAITAGAVLPLQALINGRLAAGLGGSLPAANVSFAVAAVALVVLQVALRLQLPNGPQVASVPLWAWLGGLLGVVYVAGAIVSVGAMGAAAAVCLMVAGQIGAALLIDQFAILGAPDHPVTLLRVFGAILVAAGTAIVILT
jgi:bacterial/archaeal transporter family-2 protein